MKDELELVSGADITENGGLVRDNGEIVPVLQGLRKRRKF